MNTKTEARQSTALVDWQEFEGELKTREDEFASLLPPNVDKNRFIASAIAAVKQNPDLLTATKRSLFTALTKSAQDGLIPDGREGVITIYKTNTAKRGEPDRWEPVAQWNPMVGGLRKRARELDRILIDAQVIYEEDQFVWVQGDRPSIEHIPARLGTNRGEMIGAYAIFKREDGTVLHREVMSSPEIQSVREQSKATNSLMWTTFRSEGFRKSVVRRGIKSVPVSSEMIEIIKRDDEEHFDFDTVATLGDQTATLTPPRPQRSEFERNDQNAGKDTGKPAAAEIEIPTSLDRREPLVQNGNVAPTQASSEQAGTTEPKKPTAREEQELWLGDQRTAVTECTTIRALAALQEEVLSGLYPDQEAGWIAFCEARQAAILAATRKTKAGK